MSFLSSVLGAGGSVLGGMIGGPAGAKIGGTLGGVAGGMFGGGNKGAANSLLGGVDTQSLEMQKAENDLLRAKANEMAGVARGDVQSGYGDILNLQREGNQRALDIISQGSRSAIDAANQGNLGAQEVLYAGMNPYRASILGDMPDTSGLAPEALNSDLSFLSNLNTSPSLGQRYLEEQPSFASSVPTESAWQPQTAASSYMYDNIGNYPLVAGEYDNYMHYNTTPNLPIGGNVTNDYVLDQIAQGKMATPQTPQFGFALAQEPSISPLARISSNRRQL